MEFLGIFSSALFLFLLLLIILNIYCIHTYYKLNDKINQIHDVINSIRKEHDTVISSREIKKEINILPENFKNFYYPPSPSSLIEVSSDDNTTTSYETYSDDEEDIDVNFDNCKIKNVHMSLKLDDLEDIHVLLLDEISNVEIQSNDLSSVVEELKPVVEELNPEVEELKELKPEVEELKELKPEVEELKELKPEVEDNINELCEPKELNFKPKKRESRKNMGDGDYKKMNLTDLRKYIIENNINVDASKMKKPEILRAMEELKKNECKEIVRNEYNNDFKENEYNNDFKENEFKDDEIVNSSSLVDVEEIL
jgi:hypothetical protein